MTKEDTMTNDTRILNDADLEIVTGGAGAPITLSGNNIVLPQIPRDKDLLTPQMIQKLLSIAPIPQIPHS
jgi:hypothetical protein